MKIDLADPTAVLVAVSQALEAARLPAAAYGGLALAMYGEPRETKDAHLAVAAVTGEQAEAAFRAAGFDLIRAFDEVKFGGQLVSRLTLIGGLGGSLNTIDLVEPRSPQLPGVSRRGRLIQCFAASRCALLRLRISWC